LYSGTAREYAVFEQHPLSADTPRGGTETIIGGEVVAEFAFAQNAPHNRV